MIQDVGNEELFELFETDPRTQCKACLSYWSEGIVYCTCEHLLQETVSNRSFIVYTLDLLSIPEYVIKEGRPRGHRYGKLLENKEYHLAHNLRKRCITRQLKGIHDRFLRDDVFRERMIEDNRCEDVLSCMGSSCRTRSPVECQNQNIFTTGKIGGSLSISPEARQNQ